MPNFLSISKFVSSRPLRILNIQHNSFSASSVCSFRLGYGKADSPQLEANADLIYLVQAPLREPPSRTAQPTKSILKKPSTSSFSKHDLLFPASKKDKRRIRHAQLMNKITKLSAKKPRRRRPNRKLVTTLDSLADALPEAAGSDIDTGAKVAAGGKPEEQISIITRKSVKSRPGAMRRREKLDKGERERFAKNMAQLSASAPSPGDGKEKLRRGSETQRPIPSTSERWAALRGFISQTLETKPELKNIKT
ncbi:uncharacterized protein Z518_10336 [Rhinocladiella mackenziei CBS 650.93]|uniref:Ribosome biogenesis protein SLX9 n=1 Tax=Rhinocladiella mackenziei CBS 650.93 TaxID=1442369 RepID=A0A0D2GPB6_9EURO|nr:uncharacterized protein Z518_10336 [Rhinocladiella mackenziei CBS 650.93]KIX00198.1 hypothetical protein Z518_10336 [Rhinocladiella mackenziei CBS 650.93]